LFLPSLDVGCSNFQNPKASVVESSTTSNFSGYNQPKQLNSSSRAKLALMSANTDRVRLLSLFHVHILLHQLLIANIPLGLAGRCFPCRGS
jgi:hypothetical protein